MRDTPKYNPNITYTDLQKIVDEMVGKHGLQDTVTILQVFAHNSKLNVSEKGYKLKKITDHVIEQSILLFDLKKTPFYTSTIPEYRQARMACFHILKEYTGSSYAKIGEHFNRSLDSIYYYYHECQQILDSRHLNLHKDFVDKYSHLQKSTINFIAELK